MRFEQTVIKDPNFPGLQYEDIFYISGNYKIRFYHKTSFMNGLDCYAAYVKQPAAKNWGDHVDPATPFYRTLKEAKAACERHLKGSEL